MIIYKKSGDEIEYGRAKRVYLYDKFEDPTPSWVTISGAKTVTADDDLQCGIGNISSRLFNLANVDAIRFSLNNFRKATANYAISLGIESEDGTVRAEFKSAATPSTVGLFYNNTLVENVPKFTFNGTLVAKPRKIGIHYCPLSGFLAMLENNKVVYYKNLTTKLDLAKKYRFYLIWDANTITVSQIEIINWLSY